MQADRRPGKPSLARNTIARSTPIYVGYLASFISAPVVIAGIGLRAFGIWALTGAIANYATLLDFGVGPSMSRFVALYDTENRPDLVGEVMSAGLATSLLVGVGMTVLSIVIATPLAHQVRGITPNGMRALLLASTCIFVCGALVNVLVAYRVGLRRMVATGVLQTIGVAFNFAFSVGAVLISSSVVFYGLANAAASVIALLLTAAYILSAKDRRGPYRRPTLATTKHLIAFATRNQMQTAADLINTQTDKIVIGIFIGPAAAGGYELANRVAAAARSVGSYTMSAMVPTLTVELRQTPREAWDALYERLTAVTTTLSVPPLLLAAALAPILLSAWLGHTPPNSTLVLAALSVAYIAITTTGVGFSFAYAGGFPGLPARAAVVTAVINIVLTAGLAPLFGIWGVLAGTAFAFTFGALLQVVLVHRRLEMPLVHYWRAALTPVGPAVGLAVPVLAISLMLAGSPRAAQAVAVCVCGGGYMLLYATVAHRQGWLPTAISSKLARLPLPGRTVRAVIGPPSSAMPPE